MNTTLEVRPTSIQKRILSRLYNYLTGSGMGVTMIGQFVTVRYYVSQKLVQVTMVITDIDDGKPEPPEENK